MKKLLISTALVGVAFAFTQPVEAAAKKTGKAAKVEKKMAAPQAGERDVVIGAAAPGRMEEATGADRNRINSNDPNKLALSVSGEVAFEATGVTQSHRGSTGISTPATAGGAPALPAAATAAGAVTRSHTTQKNSGHHMQMADASIAFTLSSETDMGFLYGATIELDGLGNKLRNAGKAYISIEKSPAGSVYLGNVKGPSSVLLRNGTTMQAGNNNFSGNWSDSVFVPAGALISKTMAGDTKTATKISYYTPSIAGFKVGFAYTPNAEHRGDAPLNDRSERNEVINDVESGSLVHTKKPYYNRSIIELAANFAKEFAGVAVDATAAVIYGKTRDQYVAGEVDPNVTTNVTAGGVTTTTYVFPLNRRYRDVTAYTVGANVTYANVTVGAGFTDNLKSNTVKAANMGAQGGAVEGGKIWNAGLGYRMGKTYVSGEYAGSTRRYRAGAGAAGNGAATTAATQRVSTDFYALAGEHKLAPGMLAYAQAATFKIDSRNPGAAAAGSTNRSNKGSTFTLGTRLLF